MDYLLAEEFDLAFFQRLACEKLLDVSVQVSDFI
jgi:hypothetical protein